MMDWAMDLGLGALLLATVIWCALINRQLRRLRADKGAFDQFIGALNAANDRAEKALKGLRKEGEETTRRLEREQLKAKRRADDLAQLVQGAGRLSKRLETTLAAVAKHTGASTGRASVDIGDELARHGAASRRARADGVAKPSPSSQGEAERAALSVASAFVDAAEPRAGAKARGLAQQRDEARPRIEAPPPESAAKTHRDRRELMAALRALR